MIQDFPQSLVSKHNISSYCVVNVILKFFMWFSNFLCDFAIFYVILKFLCDFEIFYVIFKIRTCQPEIWKCNGHVIFPKVDVWFEHWPLRYDHQVKTSWYLKHSSGPGLSIDYSWQFLQKDTWPKAFVKASKSTIVRTFLTSSVSQKLWCML